MSEVSVTVAATAKKPGFASAPADGSSHPLPRAMGRLLLLKLLARGGMGDVYLAATTGLEGAERACVVKTVRRDHMHDGSFLARFLDEARVQAQLNHPGVAQVLEAATDDAGEPFTVVEYIEGRSLADVRHRALQMGAKIGWPEAVAITIEMAQALAHVHDRAGVDGSPLGIVHRDLSPQNVMIGYGGDVKLIDFGTARGQNRRCHTVAGVVFAKPGYVAPEVARQEVGDGRIDVYALGVMLWEMCKGGRLLVGDPQRHLEDAAAGLTIIPLVARTASAPAALDEVIAKLTANDPNRRYGNAALAVADLAGLLAGAPETKSGERGVRARVSNLMRTLWPQEPAKSRGEFARLLKEARAAMRAPVTTPVSAETEAIATRLLADGPADPNVVSGTPYRIIRTIGEGASGLVYEAEHVELGRRVALKVLAPGHASAVDAIERFRSEARAVARLSHPNLVPLYDFGKSLDGRVYLAMELLTGEPLDKHLRRTRGMDYREAVNVGIEACKALEAAHGAGLVHRDLKPGNLFLTEGGGLKLLDFGVAMALADVATSEKEKRQAGFAIFGTPEYMSPEQGMGDPLDARSDLYSIGVILFQLLVGRLPFQAETALGIVFKQVNEPPPIPSTLRPGVDAHLEAVCLKALSKRREDRYQTAREMRSALRAFFGTDVTRGASVPMSMPATARLGRRPSLEHADTVGMPVSDGSAPTMRDGGDSDVDPIGTPGGTAALPALPVAHTNPWILGAIAVVVGAGVTALVAAQLGHPDARPSQATPGTLLDAAAASPLTSASPLASASASAWSTLVVPPRHLVAPTTSASVGARPSASPVSTPKPPASAPALSSPPAGSAVAGGFSLDTSAASPTVTRASGATAHDVRTAIPSWKLTQCYRDALQRGNKAIDGHLVLNLTIDGSGAVSRVGVKGPAPLVSGTGDCMIDAMGHVTVSNAAATGGTAEVDVACTPR